MKGLAVNLTAYGKPAPPPSHSPWKTLRVSHSLTASTTNISDLTLYRGTPRWRVVLPHAFKNNPEVTMLPLPLPLPFLGSGSPSLSPARPAL